MCLWLERYSQSGETRTSTAVILGINSSQCRLGVMRLQIHWHYYSATVPLLATKHPPLSTYSTSYVAAVTICT